MKCVKEYELRSTAEVDASRLMSSGIPSIITGHDKAPQILSDFPREKISLTVSNKHYNRAMIVLANKDNLFIKTVKILSYRRKKIEKILTKNENTDKITK